jgi:hypothetical protein
VKVLFFHAAAATDRPAVLGAFMGQAGATLRPFNNYLKQAIHTAKQRQVRYQLPWEPVRNTLTVRLEAMDTILRIPRRQPGFLLPNWPPEKVPDLTQQGFVIVPGHPVTIKAARLTPDGLLLQTEPRLQAGDQLVWCASQCEVVQETAPAPPRELTDTEGAPLGLLAPPEQDGDFWQFRVEGRHTARTLCANGEVVQAEILPTRKKVHLTDEAGHEFVMLDSKLEVEETPANGPLRGDDGVRYRWSTPRASGRRGHWVQLLPPERSDGESTVDPRAAFCEGDVREVWTQARHSKQSSFQVMKVDSDRYQLLLRERPPLDTTLFLPVNVRNLHLQRRALHQLAEAPLPHHQGLLRLCEDPAHARWPSVAPSEIHESEWRALTDETRSGTEQQRRFVSKALGSPDFAFLEGPPGSGKTTAICEIVQQLVDDGKRVLLCASTHVAIDNVLERLLETDAPIDAVRIGHQERVDDAVHDVQLGARIDALISAWQRQPTMKRFGTGELREMAERTIIMASNLTCGTTMGIVSHPLFRGRDQDRKVWERPITTMPHWDVLIVDEASKTLIQEFMVPALMAKRWMVVGDVRQLPPFTDRADVVANLRDLVDQRDRPIFPRDHQRACLLLFRMVRKQVNQPGMRWLFVEAPGVLTWIEREFGAAPSEDLLVVRVVSRAAATAGPVAHVTLRQLEEGSPDALKLAAAHWVLVSDDLINKVSHLLPANLLFAGDLASGLEPVSDDAALWFRQKWWAERTTRLPRPYRDKRFKKTDIAAKADCQACETDWLSRNSLADQLAWRITRVHELRHSRTERERTRLLEDMERLCPYATDISESLAEIEDIGLPSILEVLQQGIGAERSKRPSALTQGLRAKSTQVFDARFESLCFQHRMHPQISEFSREVIYDGGALKDANTIEQRDQRIQWDFGDFPARRVWMNVSGREQNGANPDEVNAAQALIEDFIAWAKVKGPPNRSAKRWEVAVLSFYVKQNRAMSMMLRQLTGDDRSTRFTPSDAPVEIVCGTVDRFQGREADLVLLSMRNTQRVGFLDSPNRLNVALTRARQQVIVLGNAAYFGRCGTSELEDLVKRTALEEPPPRHRTKRGHR